jgi:hypothetical protein
MFAGSPRFHLSLANFLTANTLPFASWACGKFHWDEANAIIGMN